MVCFLIVPTPIFSRDTDDSSTAGPIDIAIAHSGPIDIAIGLSGDASFHHVQAEGLQAALQRDFNANASIAVFIIDRLYFGIDVGMGIMLPSYITNGFYYRGYTHSSGALSAGYLFQIPLENSFMDVSTGGEVETGFFFAQYLHTFQFFFYPQIRFGPVFRLDGIKPFPFEVLIGLPVSISLENVLDHNISAGLSLSVGFDMAQGIHHFSAGGHK